MARDIISPNLDYIRKLYAPQDALLASIDDMLKKLGSTMHIGPEEGKLLQMLVTLYEVNTIVEVGTFGGYSTTWLARALPEEGHIYTLERDPKHIEIARHFFDQCEVGNRITLMEGEASNSLSILAYKAPFDMIFIDADKRGYNDYLDWAEKYVRQYGLIVADNTLLFDTVALDAPPQDMAPSTWEGMRRFNERLADPEKYFSIMIPTREGLTVAIKRF